MNEQKPSKGRVVIYRTQDSARQYSGEKDHPAIITRAWNDTMINCTVLPDFGQPYSVGSQQLIDPKDETAQGFFWPPRV